MNPAFVCVCTRLWEQIRRYRPRVLEGRSQPGLDHAIMPALRYFDRGLYIPYSEARFDAVASEYETYALALLVRICAGRLVMIASSYRDLSPRSRPLCPNRPWKLNSPRPPAVDNVIRAIALHTMLTCSWR